MKDLFIVMFIGPKGWLRDRVRRTVIGVLVEGGGDGASRVRGSEAAESVRDSIR